jgi:hypothetical protein
MLHSMHNAPSTRARGMGSALAVMGTVLLLACDRDRLGPFDPSGAEVGPAATFPIVMGNYTGTGVVKARHSSGASYTFTCPGTIDIATQTEGSFSGTFAVQGPGKCGQESGTVAGTVSPEGSLTFTADLPGGGPDVWADAAARTGCRLVSSTPFTGALSGGALSGTGSAVYDCPTFFGKVRLFADAQVSATRP